MIAHSKTEAQAKNIELPEPDWHQGMNNEIGVWREDIDETFRDNPAECYVQGRGIEWYINLVSTPVKREPPDNLGELVFAETLQTTDTPHFNDLPLTTRGRLGELWQKLLWV